MAHARFKPTRAGIVNLWDYRDQEFSFADGRLVLRGPNGSGKTKALEVLFPFVFDGRIEPRRLNPFAGEERTMKSNLLYRGQDSAHSYVWMEFARGSQDDPEAVTVGIGMRASRQNDKVTRWYFVAEGRVGVDFSLLGSDDRPLTKKQLAEQLGSDAITDRPVDYRAAIDARLFGLGTERYDQLINLILTLRRPQLAKNLDPKGLSQALTDGLRPLDEQLVLEAARSFSDMEEVSRALEGLAAADQAAHSFVTVYSKYLSQQARTDVEQVSRRIESVERAKTVLDEAVALQTSRQEERLLAEGRFTAAERALEQGRADLETLQRSGAYEGKQQLDDLAAAVAQLKLSTEQQADKARRAQATLEQRTDEATRASDSVKRATAELVRAEEQLAEAAEQAGIVWSPLPDGARSDQITTAVRGHAEERDGDVRAVRAALATVDKAGTERARADRAADKGRELLEAAQAAVAEAEATVALARADCAAALRAWWTEHSAEYASIGVTADVFSALDTALSLAGEDDSPSLTTVLHERTQSALDDQRARRRHAVTEQAAATERIAALRADRDRVAAEKDDAPARFAFRTGDRSELSGAPLWRLVRFADGVEPAVAAGVESALAAANLLDGWVSAGDSAQPDAESEQFLVPLSEALRPQGPTLADVLEVEPDAGVPEEVVQAIIESIALDGAGAASAGAVGVGVDGRFWQGVQRGRHVKADAEYIGTTARKRRRAQRIEEIAQEITETEARRDTAHAEESETTALLDRISTAGKSLPRTSGVLAAIKKLTEAAGALRSRSESTASAGEELDHAIADHTAKDKELRAVAVAHRMSHQARDIDAVAASIRHFESRGEQLLRCRREQEKELELHREAVDRLEEARGNTEEFVEEAAVAEENYAQQISRLETLREALGSSAEQIDADLEQVRARIEVCKTEQRSARKAYDAAVEQIGKAEGAHSAAIEALRSALTETRTDVDRLAPYARRDLLDLLGVEGSHSWPQSSAAWLTADQLVYRIATEGDVESPILPPEVDALYRAMDAATASVKTSENAKKATRSALTAALQDFDAQLAAAGQDYRLQWDAPDGLTVVRVQDDQGYSSIGEFATRIAAARQDQEVLLTDSERRILEDALLTGLAQQIHERTADARDLIAQMGAEMRERRMSSGSTIGVHWVLADNLDDSSRAVSKLLDRAPSALSADELATVRAHFAAQVRIARAAHPERSYPEILAAALDYRRWRVFSFTLIGGDGSEDRLTVARHSALSGGEQSVSLHLPLFAAAHVMLSSADPHSPRLLGLDEAFAGVDDNGRSELLGLSVQFDLDLFMTGYDLWITYGGVPGCAHYDLAHSTAEQSVSAALLVWSGGELLAEHDGSDLARALGSPMRRRVPATAEGGLEFAEV
ncbi:TIGR02680 family protein [Rhodococcus sp. TAF43]|uniref:TIGR02680 family protein n=1 Tax=unclassified Rhodococcus (in: high G+C Gram-positive bacteria) TaxID=192944 RepID=UPI001582D5DD|nr:TIGR02680 family protein [Rhodococcus sp. W8901]QKT11528.1 TIGR02680 family protein [Rhodococcus sp. W8901]